VCLGSRSVFIQSFETNLGGCPMSSQSPENVNVQRGARTAGIVLNSLFQNSKVEQCAS
jgi:hypothetical protein